MEKDDVLRRIANYIHTYIHTDRQTDITSIIHLTMTEIRSKGRLFQIFIAH